MKIKMIATDLDGTLLQSDHQIGKKTRQTLMKLAQKGVKIVPASGRPLTGVLPYTEKLGLAGKQNYAVLFNGAVVQNLAGKSLIRHQLAFSDAAEMLKLQKKAPSNLHFMREDRFYTLDHELSIQMGKTVFLNRMKIKIMDQLPADFSYLKAEFTGEGPEMDRLGKEFPVWLFEKYNVARTDPMIWEINERGASKGMAVHELAQLLGIRDQEVVVFGDQGNDLSMFENPNFYKVAMGNAIDELKEKADFVTRNNDDEGISYALERLVTEDGNE